MRKTKEFLIEACDRQEIALARLFETMLEYLRTRSGVWKWHTQPETLTDSYGQWKAYARIEFL